MELLGDREEDLDRAFGIGFCEPDVSEREDEAALAVVEESAHRSQRAKSFVAGKRVRGHDFQRLALLGIWPVVDCVPAVALFGPVIFGFRLWFGARGSSWRACAAAYG